MRAAGSLTPESLVELRTRRLDVEAAEPPVYRVLDVLCHNELVTALGRDPAHRLAVTKWQSRVAADPTRPERVALGTVPHA